jgi:hypothetical protein
MRSGLERSNDVVYRRPKYSIHDVFQYQGLRVQLRLYAHGTAGRGLRCNREDETEFSKHRVRGGHIDALRTSQHRLGLKQHANGAQSQGLLDPESIGLTFRNSRRDPPPEKFRITFDVGSKVEYLLATERQSAAYPLDHQWSVTCAATARRLLASHGRENCASHQSLE